jgi:chemotaxis signal transduction protein
MDPVLLGCRFADAGCAIPSEAVVEVLHLPALTRAPGTAPAIAGWFLLAGAVVPVVDCARLFGLAASPPGDYAPLVLLHGPPRTALLVDALTGLLRAPRHQWLPMGTGGGFRGCCRFAVTTQAGQPPLPVLEAGLLLKLAAAAIASAGTAPALAEARSAAEPEADFDPWAGLDDFGGDGGHHAERRSHVKGATAAAAVPAAGVPVPAPAVPPAVGAGP